MSNTPDEAERLLDALDQLDAEENKYAIDGTIADVLAVGLLLRPIVRAVACALTGDSRIFSTGFQSSRRSDWGLLTADCSVVRIVNPSRAVRLPTDCSRSIRKLLEAESLSGRAPLDRPDRTTEWTTL